MITTSWQNILAAARFPTKTLLIDVESYFDKEFSLSKMSTVEYICDSRFELTGLGYQWLDGAGGFLSPAETESFLTPLRDKYGPELAEVTLVGQNLKYDALVLRERFGITPKYVVDVVDLSRHLDARDRHDLAHTAKKYNAPTPKGDTMQFSGYRWRDMDEVMQRNLEDYCLNDVQIEGYLFRTLLPRITRPDIELRLANQTLHQYLVPQIRVDTELGERLIVEMTAELQKPVDEVNATGLQVVEPGKITKRTSIPPTVRPVTVADVSKDKTFLSLLKLALPEGELVPMKQGKAKMIPALAKTDSQLDYLLSHPEPRVRTLMTARKATDTWPTHISRVRNLMAQASARGGYMGAPLKYYGAGPGRWSGCEGLNVQNFGARDVHSLVLQVGRMLCAPDGHVFGTGDLSQIEARVLAWFAGQDDLLEAFRQGRDIYSEFAQDHLYHREVRKPTPDDSPELAKSLKTMRNVGKETILGAGYSMGGGTFYQRCLQKPSLKEAFESGDLNAQLCYRAIAVYRQRFGMIPAFWYELEKAWRFVARYRDQQATVSHNGHALRLWNENGTVVLQLPSGRCLFYPHATASAVDDTCRYRWGHVYGGLLTENVCQATARDVFAEGMLRLEDAGLRPLFSVHDQAICLFDKDGAEDKLHRMHELQCVTSAWAEGLPVATEGGLSERYKK